MRVAQAARTAQAAQAVPAAIHGIARGKPNVFMIQPISVLIGFDNVRRLAHFGGSRLLICE
jgi:hypothetical protein